MQDSINSSENKVNEKEEGQPTTFAEPTDYIIKNYWAEGDKHKPGNPEITGIQLKWNYVDRHIESSMNNNEVFHLVEMQAPNMCTFAIDSMAGDRLLSVREPANVTGRELELLRADVPICKVVRKSMAVTMHNRYEVQFMDPTAKKIDCNGHWPHGFTFEANPSGEKLASTEQTTSTTQQEWQLHVAAGEDAVLFIGIACAISYMRYKSMDNKKKFLIVNNQGFK
mmetsp:Transcript_8506/g.9457  ORF Transcript_8506/g.9457 Transcript_8506/m.9457 type:complete len:225 (+) Transcript_8506:141-815(+)